MSLVSIDYYKKGDINEVLILVVMDVSCEGIKLDKNRQIAGLNPCCNGCLL